MNENRGSLILVLIVSILLLSACAGPNSLVNVPSQDGSVAGFWMGLWHGFIAPITWAISLITLFSDSMNFYEVHNNGGWYNFGFMMRMWVLPKMVELYIKEKHPQ